MFSVRIIFTTTITQTVMDGYDTAAIGASPTLIFPLKELFKTVLSDKGEITHKRFYHRIGVGIPALLIDNLPARILRTFVTESVRQCFPYFARCNSAQIGAIITFATFVPATDARAVFSQCLAANCAVQPAWGNHIFIHNPILFNLLNCIRYKAFTPLPISQIN